jgi:hypothetical protein
LNIYFQPIEMTLEAGAVKYNGTRMTLIAPALAEALTRTSGSEDVKGCNDLLSSESGL